MGGRAAIGAIGPLTARLLPWTRLLALVLAIAAFVIVPFVLWGERMDAVVPDFVRGQHGQWAIAAIGIALLVLDVILPIPSSVVSVALCLFLGPAWGALTVFSGMTASFAAGYLLGRLLPAARLRAWVGPATWDLLASSKHAGNLLWIGAARPVPVFAEVTAILAGSLRLPLRSSLLVASLSSALVAIAYGLSARLGMAESASTTVLVVCSASLPAASWVAYCLIRRAIR